MNQEPPHLPPAEGEPSAVDALRTEIYQLAHRVRSAESSRKALYISLIVAGFAALMGTAGGYLAGRQGSRLNGVGRIESGLIPVELNQQTLATGSITFSKPFARKPLVFVCEAGHVGAFLVCKTDAISEGGFTWAVGAGPVRRDYRSELAWFAFEPQ